MCRRAATHSDCDDAVGSKVASHFAGAAAGRLHPSPNPPLDNGLFHCAYIQRDAVAAQILRGDFHPAALPHPSGCTFASALPVLFAVNDFDIATGSGDLTGLGQVFAQLEINLSCSIRQCVPVRFYT